MKQLIINADDFGLHTDVNQGIIQGHKLGCITSTSLMPGGKAFEEAIALSLDNPHLGVGVHLTLVGANPVCEPCDVSSLVDYEGRLSANYIQFLRRFMSGKVHLGDIRKELVAQVKKVVATGIPITHLDSHQHMHIVPGIIDITIDIAKEFGIKAIRIPAEPYLFLGGYPFSAARIVARAGLTFLSGLARSKVQAADLGAPACFFGMLAGGNMQEEFLLNIVDHLPDGISEIMMHPAINATMLKELYPWNYHWQEELGAVMSKSVIESIEREKIRLVSFGVLAYG
jgi:hopanoid biosynthesis associated protein HpnK